MGRNNERAQIHSRLALTVADPNIQIREGPSHPESEIRGVLVSKKFFPGTQAPSLDPPLIKVAVMSVSKCARALTCFKQVLPVQS